MPVPRDDQDAPATPAQKAGHAAGSASAARGNGAKAGGAAAAEDAMIAATIGEWQKRLLQPDRRNNLLYFPARSPYVMLANVTPSDAGFWAEDDPGWRFSFGEPAASPEGEQTAFPPRPGAEADFVTFNRQWGLGALAPRPVHQGVWRFYDDPADAPQPVRSAEVPAFTGEIDTELDPDKLRSVLERLLRSKRDWREEQGLNVLSVAAGFLRWRDADGEEALSPLVLAPCDLVREASPGSPSYVLHRGDGRVEANATLMHHLATLGIELPAKQEDQAIPEYLEAVRVAVRGGGTWAVEDRTALGVFAFAKMAMYEDLDRMKRRGVTHSLVRRLAGSDGAGAARIAPAAASARPLREQELAGGGLDDLLKLNDQYAVMSADFSQLRAIHDAVRGEHLVIHGPPGTGKSQTIANLVATLLAKGKRVLFVSEKSAALDVVRRRLEECGLGVFCLDLHGARGGKISVYEQLAASMKESGGEIPPAPSFRALRDHRERLNGFVRALHLKREPFGLSAYEAHGRYALVQHLPILEFAGLGEIGALDGERHERIENLANAVGERPDWFGEHAERGRFWRALRHERRAFELGGQIAAAARLAGEDAADAARRFSEIAEWTGVSTVPAGAGQCAAIADLLDLLAQGNGVPPHWFAPGELDRLAALAEEMARRQEIRAGLENGARRAFGGARPPAGYAALADALRRVEDEAPALEALAGGGWPRWIMANPERLAERIGEASAAAADAAAAAGELAAMFGERPRSFTTADLASAAERAERLLRLYPAPESWLDPAAERDARRHFGRLAEWFGELGGKEAELRAGFDADLPSQVDRGMRDRYRTDYGSWRRRLGGGWRRDQRLLRASLGTPRKLALGEARAAAELAYEVRTLREAWSERVRHARERFGSRVGDWDPADPEAREGIEQLGRDMDETISARGEWRGESASLRALLTDEEHHGALAVAAREARATLDRFAAAVAALDLPVPPGENVPLDDTERILGDALRPVQALIDADADGVIERLAEPAHDFRVFAGLCGDMAELERIEREDEQEAAELRGAFGARLFGGAGADWQAVAGEIGWARQVLALAGGTPSERLSGHAARPAASSEYSGRADGMRRAAAAADRIGEALGAHFDETRTSWGSWASAPFAELRSWAETVASRASSAGEWLEYRNAVRDLDAELGEGSVSRIRERTANAADIPGVVRRCILNAWLTRLHAEDRTLGDFSVTNHESVRERFRALDRQQIESARERVRRACLAEYPEEAGALDPKFRPIREENSKQRGRMPVRRLFRRAAEGMLALKPVMLMSPLAVSQFLPAPGGGAEDGQSAAGEMFDVAIFDEASQIFPEEAVPAIARAKQAVVVGDRKQLPPTGFFQRSRDDGDEEEDGGEDEDGGGANGGSDQLAGRESILDAMTGLAGTAVGERRLSMHYRSRHEDLIRYSNHCFYEDGLLTFPPPDSGGTEWLGVRSEYVPEGVYEQGGARVNRPEAERVVDEVFRLMRERPEESVGVVALSQAQAGLIERLVDERRRDERSLDARFAEEGSERFFVKNLENVQGDERDHVFLSVGYGPVRGGGTPQRFGPINNEGGERRLNVAVTRARRSMTVVHSLHPDNINEESRHAGPRLLRRYLEYVMNPAAPLGDGTSADPDADPESPFEEAVRSALESRGHKVFSQVGSSGYRIDLAIGTENGTGFDLGIECDGATYHRAPAARDRDRLRQEVLEGLGWRIHRVWSTAWLNDPAGQLEKIERALGEARAAKRRAPETAPRGGGEKNGNDEDGTGAAAGTSEPGERPVRERPPGGASERAAVSPRPQPPMPFAPAADALTEPLAATEDELRAALGTALGEGWRPEAEALAEARRGLPRGSADALRRVLHRAVRDGWIVERGGDRGAPELRRASEAPGMRIGGTDAKRQTNELSVVTLVRGFLKRAPLDAYRVQAGGLLGETTLGSLAPSRLAVCAAGDALLIFTRDGRVHRLALSALNAGGRLPLGKLTGIGRSGDVAAMTTAGSGSLVLATAGGAVKRVEAGEFDGVRAQGAVAMKIERGDRLVAAHPAEYGDAALLVSAGGRALRFAAGGLRAAGRPAGGVRGMRLQDGDEVVGIAAGRGDEDLLVVSEQGIGKRTPFAEYAVKGRGGQGVRTFRASARTGRLVAAHAVRPERDDLILVSREGEAKWTRADAIVTERRDARGAAIVRIGRGDALVFCAPVPRRGVR